MRGEYKVPGGKLVAADVEVAGGALTEVSVSGDFFLEPDAALAVIDESLRGRPADARVADLTTAIEDGLRRAEADGRFDAPVQMVGFTPEAVAIAVRRALGHATSWQDHTFELIHPGPLPPAVLGALDQVLTEELAAGRRGPTLRFWEWDERAVFIGSFQSLRNEVDPEGVAKHEVTVVRRISGGGAMFMEAGNCITFSLVVPASLVDGLSFEQSYRFLDDWVIGALADVGVTATFSGLNDIASPAGKIAGSAQKRLAGGAVLHHMTMATTSTPTRCSRCCGSAARSCPTRARPARTSASTRCGPRRGCRASRSSTRSSRTSGRGTGRSTATCVPRSWSGRSSSSRRSSATRSGPRACRDAPGPIRARAAAGPGSGRGNPGCAGGSRPATLDG